MKYWEQREPQFDPPGLEEAWIKYTTELLQRKTKPTKSELKCCQIGLRKYSAASAGKARHLMGRVNAALKPPDPKAKLSD